MPRAFFRAIVVLSVLAKGVGAQGPTIGSTLKPEVAGPPVLPVASLGEPQIQLMPPPTAASYTGTYTTVPRPASDPVSVTGPGESLLPSGAENGSAPRLGNPWFENLSLFFGADG